MNRWFPPWTAIVAFGALTALLLSASIDAAEPSGASVTSDGRILIAWSHVVLLVGVVIGRRFVARFEAPHEQPQAAIARSAWRQYGLWIDALCLRGIALYTLLLHAWTRADGFEATAAGRATMVGVELVNALGGLAYFFLFFGLDRPTVNTVSGAMRNPARPGWRSSRSRRWPPSALRWRASTARPVRRWSKSRGTVHRSWSRSA